jgi:alanine racemase
MAIIKADAYGHGAIEVARALEDIVFGFGVAVPEEGVQLRRCGIKKPILILGNLIPEKIPDVLKYDLTPSVSGFSVAEALSNAAVAKNTIVKIHVGVDTGMGRIGFLESEKEKIAEIKGLKNLLVDGLCTHYTCADETDKTYSENQKKRFDDFGKFLKKRGIEPRFKHISNSAGIIDFDAIHYDLARAGIMIYGLYPSKDVDQNFGLIPAMSWYARISHVKTLPENYGVSYGATYVTKKPTRIATIPVGYADGYPRALSGKGRVIINGRFAPITGRVCMDQFMVDVTDIPDVEVGTQAILVGTYKDKPSDITNKTDKPQTLSIGIPENKTSDITNETDKSQTLSIGISENKLSDISDENKRKTEPQSEIKISVEELADAANSFNYEFVCGIGLRVPKYYYKNGKFLKRINYLENIIF